MSTIRAAEEEDAPSIVTLMRRYYGEDGYPFDDHAAKRAVSELLADQGLGRLWVIERGGDIVGYLAVTLGFSVEYRGRDAFLDELYLLPEARGEGTGKEALAVAERWCREAGVPALHLEVERGKTGAIELYRRAGFEDRGRLLLSKRGPGR